MPRLFCIITLMKKIVIFSGAGMSAESGIDTFRDSNGLWENHRVEDVATPQAWMSDPDLVTKFYNERRKRILDVAPNNAHIEIAALEELAEVAVVTQNIDDLHERAGSSSVLHLHGNIMYSKSSGPNQEREYYKIQGWQLGPEDRCPEGYRLRPHVVWFGEDVPVYSKAIRILEQADLLLVIGTSLQVHPAAGLIHYATNALHKFIIDPKVSSLNVPSGFIKIEGGASDGIERILSDIKSILSK